MILGVFYRLEYSIPYRTERVIHDFFPNQLSGAQAIVRTLQHQIRHNNIYNLQLAKFFRDDNFQEKIVEIIVVEYGELSDFRRIQ